MSDSPKLLPHFVRVRGQGKDVDKNGEIDWAITGPRSLTIDATTRKKKDRTYTIVVGCTDASGNRSREKTTVLVSHVR